MELFIRSASQNEGEGQYEFLKIYCAVVVSVKDAEEVFSELARVSRGEDPLEEEHEFLPVESAVRIVLHENVVAVCACVRACVRVCVCARVLVNRERERDV